ncbi:MAG TPA: transcription termination/antitermination NusG family protein [Bryobacteraceae bacterium]|nr:transcription termination/antitermination NusG family protein [Bryobacteraceae bacterium]
MGMCINCGSFVSSTAVSIAPCKIDATAQMRWFALHVRPRSERLISDLVRLKGYEDLLPAYRCRRHWSDRLKRVEVPLFPGYIFCRLDLHNRMPVLTTPGVIRLVGFGNQPVPVEDEEIEAIRRILDSGVLAEPWAYMPVGARVRIDEGPLSGLEGFFIRRRRGNRLVVGVTLLQRSVSVPIEESAVTALDDLEWSANVCKPHHENDGKLQLGHRPACSGVDAAHASEPCRHAIRV